MKKQFSSVFAAMFVLLVFQAGIVSAQETIKQDARNFLNRSNGIIMKAKGAVEVGQVYTGDVVKAVHQQKFARELFKEGKFNKAIFHSYRARQLSFAAIKANKAKVTDDMQVTPGEKPLLKDIPNDKTLDSEVKIPANADEKSMLKDKEDELPADTK
jgi:hypothetical protein